MTEDDYLQELLDMKPAQLEKVDHDLVKWTCSIAGCQRFTRVRDFGISPLYYWRKKWVNLQERIFFCGEHWPKYRYAPDGNIIFKPGTGLNHLADNQ